VRNEVSTSIYWHALQHVVGARIFDLLEGALTARSLVAWRPFLQLLQTVKGC